MYANQTLLNNHVSDSEPVSNRLLLYNINGGGIAVGEIYVGYDPCGTNHFDGSTPNVVPHVTETLTLTPAQTGMTVANGYSSDMGFNVVFTRTGWIKLFKNGIKHIVRAKYYAGVPAGSVPLAIYPKFVVEILEIGSSVLADYQFYDTTLMFRDNLVSTNIELLGYGENNAIDINIGTNGTNVSTSYTLGFNDAMNLSGNSMNLVVTVRKNNSSGALIYSGSDQGSVQGDTLQVNQMISSAMIDGAARIWINVEITTTIPI